MPALLASLLVTAAPLSFFHTWEGLDAGAPGPALVPSAAVMMFEGSWQLSCLPLRFPHLGIVLALELLGW